MNKKSQYYFFISLLIFIIIFMMFPQVYNKIDTKNYELNLYENLNREISYIINSAIKQKENPIYYIESFLTEFKQFSKSKKKTINFIYFYNINDSALFAKNELGEDIELNFESKRYLLANNNNHTYNLESVESVKLIYGQETYNYEITERHAFNMLVSIN